VTVPTIHELNELEKVALGVIGAGLAPSSLAHDRSFRLDTLTAISLALARGLDRGALLDGNGDAGDAFQSELAATYDALDRKRILGLGGPNDVLLMPGEAPHSPRDQRQLPNFDQYPTVFDRHLAGRCLDELLKQPDVYRFIMGKYAESSEIWQRVYRQYV
jgi:hypothetical protein